MNDPEFQWRPVPGATMYRLEVAFDHKFTDIARTVDTPSTRFIDTSSWPPASYWWRVKVIAPFDGAYSRVRSFTRRWMGPDGTGSGDRVIARPDKVTVEDFAAESGIQVPANALKISWEPVAGAAAYEVQFDGSKEKVCTTPHTVLTPYLSGSLSEDTSSTCKPELAQGVHWVRVRAVDETVAGTKIYSLWSDEARTIDSAVPAPLYFTIGPNMSGSAEAEPAVLTSPRDGTVFQDVPTFEWQPVGWATEYELVVALDQDFTNVVGTFRTKDTRLVPLQRLPENTAIRSYYWYVVPCAESGSSGVACLNPNKAVNRDGKFRSFKKQSVLVKPRAISRRGTPWVEFTWEPYSTTMYRFAAKTGSLGASLGGFKWYEFQIKPRGASWDTATTTITDTPSVLPTDLRFGGRFEWRVRPVDETGKRRPWSDSRSLRTPRAVPQSPQALKAKRQPRRVKLSWSRPRADYFPVTSYAVYYSSTGKRWKPLTQVVGRRVAFKVNSKRRYWFMVTANNLAGESRPSRVFVPR